MLVLFMIALCAVCISNVYIIHCAPPPVKSWDELPDISENWENVNIHNPEDDDLLPESCIYQNKSIPAGDRFKPEPCTFCHCPPGGGKAQCAIQDCRHEPNCLKRKKQTKHDCCGLCVKFGCLDSKGVAYEPGSQIPSPDNCETCHCPKAGGRPVCRTRHNRPCPPANCVNALRQPESCCHYCPAGENCWLSDGDKEHILPAGEIRQMDGCRVCQCPNVPLPWHLRIQGPRAICTIGDCS